LQSILYKKTHYCRKAAIAQWNVMDFTQD